MSGGVGDVLLPTWSAFLALCRCKTNGPTPRLALTLPHYNTLSLHCSLQTLSELQLTCLSESSSL